MKKKNHYPVYFVGAGPGDPELITVKGKRLLEEADIVVYAGSLINKEIVSGLAARVYNSAGMDLDEIITVIQNGWQQGKKIVRLHTGDPSIFGAIKEQMVRLKELEIEFSIIPGVSSAFGAAASLQAELTLPEIAQSVIITRQEGRTKVPELERIRLLASHQTTMLIFLSVSMMDVVVNELEKGGYPLDTPVVVIEKATWDDERIVKGTLKTIAEEVGKTNIKKTAIICVGQVFSQSVPGAVSKLYDKHFSHGTRKAVNYKMKDS